MLQINCADEPFYCDAKTASQNAVLKMLMEHDGKIISSRFTRAQMEQTLANIVVENSPGKFSKSMSVSSGNLAADFQLANYYGLKCEGQLFHSIISDVRANHRFAGKRTDSYLTVLPPQLLDKACKLWAPFVTYHRVCPTIFGYVDHLRKLQQTAPCRQMKYIKWYHANGGLWNEELYSVVEKLRYRIKVVKLLNAPRSFWNLHKIIADWNQFSKKITHPYHAFLAKHVPSRSLNVYTDEFCDQLFARLSPTFKQEFEDLFTAITTNTWQKLDPIWID